MAEANPSIFNSKASEKLRSPDDLDKYVRVTNPSVWVVLVACALLLVGLLSWGLFGTVATSVAATGAVVNGKTLCYLPHDEAGKVHVTDVASMEGAHLIVSSVAQVPSSAGEARSALGSDFLANELVNGDWAYLVEFEGDVSELSENVPYAVSITVERMAPLSLVFGG